MGDTYDAAVRIQRNKYLKLYHLNLERYYASTRPNGQRNRDFYEFARDAEEEYYECLPVVTFGSCPYCQAPVRARFDPYGLDGLLWRGGWGIVERCEHFYLLCGALSWNGLPPKFPNIATEIIPGPEVPYVIRYEIEREGCIAVVAKLDMDTGYKVYAITYYLNRPREPGIYATGWKTKTRMLMKYQDDRFVGEWMENGDEDWDYDLLPYVKRGKLRWCEPEGDRTTLSARPPEECPYIDLPGVRDPIYIERGVLRHRGYY